MRRPEPRVITCSEYQTLRVGELRSDQHGRALAITTEHIGALRRFAESRKPRPFEVDSDSISFRQFVGVVCVGELTIEILPKADPEDLAPTPWRNALVQMLRAAGKLALTDSSDASIQARELPLLDIFIIAMLDGAEPLLWSGLDRAYALRQETLTVFKGRLLVSQNIRENLVHRERVFVEHAPYDHRTVANTVLRDAIRLSAWRATDSAVRARARRVLESFPPFESAHIALQGFADIPRRTQERYGTVLTVAWVLRQGLALDVHHGATRAVGLLFDMNRLFERFIGSMLAALYPGRVERQAELKLWLKATRRPDVVVSNVRGRVVLDTKWKIPWKGQPDASDLDQMFVYSHLLGAPRAVLLYPSGGARQEPLSGPFSGTNFWCETAYIDLFEAGRLSFSKARTELARIVEGAPAGTSLANVPESLHG